MCEKKYKLSKLSVSSWDGYEKTIEFDTAADLFRFLKNNTNSTFFVGKGSHVFISGEKIAHTSDYFEMMAPTEDRFSGRKITPTASIKKLIAVSESNQ